MSGAADIHRAVAALWDSGGLNTLFQSYWATADRNSYVSLNDGNAAPNTPFPYVTYTAPKSNTRSRMSGTGQEKRSIQDQPWIFNVFALKTSTLSGKELAAFLADEILKVFGGHPTVEPTYPSLDNGNCLNVQYQDDYSDPEEDEIHGIHRWVIEYKITSDIPVMVGA